MQVTVDAIMAWAQTLGWTDLVEFFFVCMSIVGQHFIAKRQSRGFYFWIAGNLAALVMFATLQRWMTFMLYVYFTWKSIEGVRTWRRLDAIDCSTGVKHAA